MNEMAIVIPQISNDARC